MHVGEMGPADLVDKPMKKADATASIGHVINGPADIGHVPSPKGDATSSIMHVGEMGPADHAHAPVD